MLRIGLVSFHTSPFAQPGQSDSGGLNVYVQQVAFALAHQGHECTIYVRKTDPDQPDLQYIEPGVRVAYIEAGDYDLTLQELPETVDDFAESMARYLSDTENFGTDILHANYWLSGVAAHQLKHEFKIPLITTFHTLGKVKESIGEQVAYQRIEAETEIAHCSEAISVVSQAELQDLINFYGADSQRIHKIEAGVNHAYFSPGNQSEARKGLGLKEDVPVLLFVGRIQPLKQLDKAIQTLAHLSTTHKSAELLVVGGPSGPNGEAALRQSQDLAKSLGLESQIRFIGPQPHYLLSTYYRAVDVVIMPSLSESFGLVALEAAACGTPVVASKVGGLTSLVENQKTGILVEGSSANFAEAVTSILDDTALSVELAFEAAIKANKYSWMRAAEKLEGLYESSMSASFVEC